MSFLDTLRQITEAQKELRDATRNVFLLQFPPPTTQQCVDSFVDQLSEKLRNAAASVFPIRKVTVLLKDINAIVCGNRFESVYFWTPLNDWVRKHDNNNIANDHFLSTKDSIRQACLDALECMIGKKIQGDSVEVTW